MSDTVEEVYVWTGTAWQPVVRDVAALPISSDDGTVTLDSPSADKFTVQTNNLDGLVVDDKSRVGVFGDPSYRFHVKELGDSEFFFSGQYTYVRQQGDMPVGTFYINNQAAGNDGRSIWGLAVGEGSGSDNDLDIWSSSVGVSGTKPFTFTKEGHFVVNGGEVHTDTITSQDAAVGDAEIKLGKNIGLNTAPAANVMVSGNTDQAFFQNFRSTNDYLTGLYEGRCGTRIANNTNGTWYAEWYLDPTAKTYGFGGSSSGSSLPIIAGSAHADIEVSPKIWVCFNTPDIKAADDYTPPNSQSLATKAYVDGRMWKGTQAEYDALGTYDDTILYLITS